MSFINLDKKSLKGDKTCKYCGLTGLTWVPSANTKSRVELVNKVGKVHNCRATTLNDTYELWGYFFKYGYPNADKIEKEHQEYMANIPPELKKKYADEQAKWLKHDAFAADGKCPCGCRKIPKTFGKKSK